MLKTEFRLEQGHEHKRAHRQCTSVIMSTGLEEGFRRKEEKGKDYKYPTLLFEALYMVACAIVSLRYTCHNCVSISHLRLPSYGTFTPLLLLCSSFRSSIAQGRHWTASLFCPPFLPSARQYPVPFNTHLIVLHQQ